MRHYFIDISTRSPLQHAEQTNQTRQSQEADAHCVHQKMLENSPKVFLCCIRALTRAARRLETKRVVDMGVNPFAAVSGLIRGLS